MTGNSGQFKPGQSGNPKGGPKKWEQCSFILEKILELGEIEEFKPNTKKEAILYRGIVQKAEQGDMRAIEILLDRIEGKAKQHNINENHHTLEDNPMYQQLKSITDRFKEKK